MAGPSPQYLAALNAGLGAQAAPMQPDPFAAGATAAGISPYAPLPAEATLMPGGGGVSVPGAPIVVPGVQPSPAPAAAGPTAPVASGAAPVMAAAAPAPTGASAPAEPDVQFRSVGGGAVPAREVSTRGPKQSELLQASYGPGLEAADRIGLRSAMAAQHAQDVYEAEAERQQEQVAAHERVAARRSFELQQLQGDYDATISDLGKTQIDPNRAWARMSTIEKIGATILAMVGGAGGGLGMGMKIIQDRIDEDVALQKLDYQRGLDVAKGKQTAYSMAMERYGSEDAAYHAAQASAQLAATAKLNALSANWKGVEEQNQADVLRSQLMSGAMRSAADGYKFLQPGTGSPKYKMMIRGQEVPGFVDEKRAQEYTIAHGVQPGERRDDEILKGGVQAAVAERKAGAERAGKTDEGKKYIASEMQRAGIPKMRKLTEEALHSLNESPGGIGEAAVRGIAGRVPAGVGDAAANRIFSDKANTREQRFQNFTNLNFHELSGAAISKQEEVRLKRALGGADPDARKRALQDMLETLDAQERSIKAGAPRGAAEAYDEDERSVSAGRPAAPAGVRRGW